MITLFKDRKLIMRARQANKVNERKGERDQERLGSEEKRMLQERQPEGGEEEGV